MTTYRDINSVWPEPYPVPTPQEAITGAKRLIRVAHRLAIQDGVVAKLRPRKFKITSGRRDTQLRGGVWHINPNLQGHWGWHQIVHSISHWAQQRYWPKADGHGALHAWIEKELADYAIKNFLDGQLKKAPAPEVDKIAVRAAAVAKRIKVWEAKRRRADTALRKLRKQERYYGRRSVGNSGVLAASKAADSADARA